MQNITTSGQPSPLPMPRYSYSVIRAVALRFNLPEQVVRNTLESSENELLARNRYYEASNTNTPTLDYPKYARYTPRTLQHSNSWERYVGYIEIVDPFDVVPSEPEGSIRQHPTFARYIEWYQAGYLPPYPSVFEQYLDGPRKLVTSNRRRILTAQEAGIRELPVWLERLNQETGLPLKYGDLVKAAHQKYAELLPLGEAA